MLHTICSLRFYIIIMFHVTLLYTTRNILYDTYNIDTIHCMLHGYNIHTICYIRYCMYHIPCYILIESICYMQYCTCNILCVTYNMLHIAYNTLHTRCYIHYLTLQIPHTFSTVYMWGVSFYHLNARCTSTLARFYHLNARCTSTLVRFYHLNARCTSTLARFLHSFGAAC